MPLDTPARLLDLRYLLRCARRRSHPATTRSQPHRGARTLRQVRGTAKAHCEHIYTKVGVRSKAQLLEVLEERG